MKIKKILASVMAASVIGGVMTAVPQSVPDYSLTVSAADYTEGTYDDLIYRKYGDHIEILGCDYSAVNVDIPTKIDDLPVTVIGEYAFYHFPEEYDPYENLLVSVKIPDTVTIIGRGAFANCSKLSSINIPDSVTVIGKSAFAGCYRLTKINIPEGVTSINEKSFFDCISLTNVTIPESVRYIGDYAFMGCEDLLSVTIPDSVTIIGDSAFWSCDSLTSVIVPKNVRSIGKDAFGSCEDLKEVTILNPICSVTGLATISNFAYYKDKTTYGNFNGTIRGYDDSTAQAYAEKYDYKFESLGEAPERPAQILGDANGDGAIDATDASNILALYAKLSTSNGTPTEQELSVGDVNKDGVIDAADASVVLAYYAYISTTTDSAKLTLEEFITKE